MERIDFYQAGPAGMKSVDNVYHHVLQSGLPKTLVDLVFLRVSLINGCAYCIDMHTTDLIKEKVSTAKIALVPAWREGGKLFDETERAALAWAETVTNVAETAVPDADYEAAAKIFNPGQLTELTIAIGLINAYSRLAISFRKTPESLK